MPGVEEDVIKRFDYRTFKMCAHFEIRPILDVIAVE